MKFVFHYNIPVGAGGVPKKKNFSGALFFLWAFLVAPRQLSFRKEGGFEGLCLRTGPGAPPLPLPMHNIVCDLDCGYPPPPPQNELWLFTSGSQHKAQSAERKLARQWPRRPLVPFCHKSET